MSAVLNEAGSRWQRDLAGAMTDPGELLAALNLPRSLEEPARRAARLFELRVTRSYLSRIRPGDVDDPLLRQVLPLDLELRETPGFTADPLEEQAARRAPGLLQKYSGRALLIATQACAIHCRYCFRREFPYEDQTGATALSQAMAAIAADPSLE